MVFFKAETLMERWYLLALFELSKLFQNLENMVFRAVVYQFFSMVKRNIISIQ